jgi:hypothetical protein
MAYKVTKPIQQNGSVIPAGTIVDASSWRNLRSLINGRFLVECAEPVVKVKKARDTELADKE